MDALFHVTMTFAGGYMLLRGLDVRFRWRELFVLSIIGGAIDLDHFYRPFGEMLLFHNVFFITLVPLAFFLVFRHFGRPKLAMYSSFMVVFWIGHLLADMISGMYGVYLFFPFYNASFYLPGWMNIWRVGTTYAVETAGFAVAIYFGLIFAIVAYHEYRKGKFRF